MGIEERNLLKGFIKTLSILLGHLPFKAFSVLGLGLEQVFELDHFGNIEILMLLEFLLQGGNLILELFLLGLPLFFPSQALVLNLYQLFL